jgi:glycosyltransferase involved in cell wall biosynthesis
MRDDYGGPSPAKVYLIAHQLAETEMPMLYAACNCFVLPSRGEGWGRPYVESMAMGLLTIGTDWGGNRDYMTPTNSLLIQSSIVPVPTDVPVEWPHYIGSSWAEPSVDHLIQLLRQVAQQDDRSLSAIARKGQADVRTRFESTHISQQFAPHLLLDER